MRTSTVAAEPCAACGTQGGYRPRGNRRPSRWPGERYGVAGRICLACRDRHRARLEAQARPGLAAPSAPSPCTECGTRGGPARRGRNRPLRYSGARFGLGFLSWLCGRCYEHRRKGYVRCYARKLIAEPAVYVPTPDPLVQVVLSRVAVVRAVKRRRYAMGFDTDLTPEILDRILPPVECRRTRERLAHEREGHRGRSCRSRPRRGASSGPAAVFSEATTGGGAA